ncbi:uncharacterized protein CLUP02_08151 [Colletotrichum lupini]|uniref:Uncharacterized protein n=1 Tax=Colletotrichum lupini TaxID=145971 RepID=A0A9Q8STS2_9PEZI|nr:uncharacterized protein CLUP02_08151 [Colletotrichum lupini]UQC82661.1 hypothetical protein CLUP02_08151 [Colletotrichum lupini]
MTDRIWTLKSMMPFFQRLLSIFELNAMNPTSTGCRNPATRDPETAGTKMGRDIQRELRLALRQIYDEREKSSVHAQGALEGGGPDPVGKTCNRRPPATEYKCRAKGQPNFLVRESGGLEEHEGTN